MTYTSQRPVSRRTVLRRSAALGSLGIAPALALDAMAQSPAGELSVGFLPGPYRDAFAQGIAPQLERAGYRVKYVEFSQGVQPNDAVQRGNIQANVFQHSLYLEANNKSQGFDLVPIVHVPTPPTGIYSQRHKTLAAVPDGATVTLPSDPVNSARALNILAALGWVKLKPGVDPVNVSERDVIDNPRKLKLVPLDAAQLPRSLDDLSIAAINNDYAEKAGLSFARDAVVKEAPRGPYANLIAVRRADVDKPWVKKLVAAYQSPEVKRFIETQFKGSLIPAF